MDIDGMKTVGYTQIAFTHEQDRATVEGDLEEAVQIAYDENRRVYGQRKLKHALLRKGWGISRRKIGLIMKKRGLSWFIKPLHP